MHLGKVFVKKDKSNTDIWVEIAQLQPVSGQYKTLEVLYG